MANGQPRTNTAKSKGEDLPELGDSALSVKKRSTLLSGLPEVQNLDQAMKNTDFRPKDMSVRRSRILESIDMTSFSFE